MKKAISLILALMLCVGILAVPALADDYAPLTIEIGSGTPDRRVTITFSEAKMETESTALTLINASEEEMTKSVTLITVKPGCTITPSDSIGIDTLKKIDNGTYRVTGVEPVFSTIVFDEVVEEYAEYGIDVDMLGISDALEFKDNDWILKWYCVVLDDAASDTPAPAKPVVQRSPQNVTVDGKAVTPDIYNINDRNYFKLRDLASLLNGTSAQFEVGYNDATKTISITTGAAYTSVGGELAAGEDKSATCVESAQALEINGAAASLTAYNIGGNNFFRLRDLNELLGYSVDYDAATNTAVITTK